MRRMKLHVDELTVDSFETTDSLEGKGTVYAHFEPSWPEGTCVATCTTFRTKPDTCRWSCDDATCWWSCDTGECNCMVTDTGACTAEEA